MDGLTSQSHVAQIAEIPTWGGRSQINEVRHSEKLIELSVPRDLLRVAMN